MIIDGITLPTGEVLDPTELGSIDSNKGMVTAWVLFDGTSGTNLTIADSFNVSAVTRLNTGLYVVNFETAMTNTNYMFVGTVDDNDVSGGYFISGHISTPLKTTTQCGVSCRASTNAPNDRTKIAIAFYGGK